MSCYCPSSGIVNPGCPKHGDSEYDYSPPRSFQPLPTRVCQKHGVCNTCACSVEQDIVTLTECAIQSWQGYSARPSLFPKHLVVLNGAGGGHCQELSRFFAEQLSSYPGWTAMVTKDKCEATHAWVVASNKGSRLYCGLHSRTTTIRSVFRFLRLSG